VSPTLNAFDNAHETRATVLVIDGTRVDDVRIYDDGLRIQKGNTVNTLSAKMGTGGNNVPIIAFDGYNQSVTEDIYRALRIGIDSGDCIAIPIQDGREMEKKQNGFGIGQEGDPSYTLDQTGAQSVAYSIREDATANTFSVTEIQTARALSALRPSVQSHHAQTFIASEEETDMQVRRLTPTECERLMGWPDGHTAIGTNGPISDTNRYKMCGNGVASPVAQWIGEHLMGLYSNADRE
jgi:DNA (cytosine-5)-methyltransferase 1